MKARFLVLAALMLGLASCQTEPEGLNVNVGGEVDTFVTVTIPETETRYGDESNSALGVFDNGVLGDENDNVTMRYILDIYYGELRAERKVAYQDAQTTVTFPVRLVAGRDYNFVVWADVVKKNDQGEWADLHYNTTDLKNVTLNNTWVAMDESRDAFTGYYNTIKEGTKYSGNLPINITLTRPFAKLRVITTDVADLTKLGLKAETATVVYTTPYRSAFNAATGTAYDAESNTKTHNFEIASYADSKDGKQVLFTDYFFATDEVVKFDLAVYDEAGNVFGSEDFLSFNTDIPVKRNYLTTIQGNILTEGNNVTVKVEDAFAQPEIIENLWDGKTVKQPEKDAEGNYLIYEGSELAWIADQVNGVTRAAGNSFKDETIKLMKDINLDYEPWTPIGKSGYTNIFNGTFDGQGHTIANLCVTNVKCAGLFGGTTGGTFKNLTIDGVKLNTNHYAGAIIAWAESGAVRVKIENCEVKNAEITVTAEMVNGEWDNGDKGAAIIGFAHAVSITDCKAENIKVKAYRDFAGIVGYADNSNIDRCETSDVELEQDLTHNYKDETPDTYGEIIGRDGGNNTIDGNKLIAKGVSYNAEDEEYFISEDAGFEWVADEVNSGETFEGKTITLTSDIDLATITTFATRSASNWTPIGTPENPFQGTFDGQGCTIKNLVIDGGSNSNIGFFGYTTNGEIKNVTFENAKVSGRLNVGVVAGTPYTSKYTNITVKGHVEVDGMAYVGGVGGKNAYADWTNITVEVDETSYVKANSVENGKAYRTYVGGVVGFNGEGGHKFSNITSNINVEGSTCDVGGLFGIAHYGNKFEECVCTGNVTITTDEVENALEMGGLAGVWHNENGQTVTFTNCSFTGELSTPNITEEVDFYYGGLIGAPYSATGTGKLIVDGYEMVAYGVLKTGENEYGIYNGEGLVWAEAQADNFFGNKTIKLMNDIDMTGIAINKPIHFWNSKPTVDGQNYTISNLTMSTDSTEKKPFSLFSGTADIKNVKFDNANISGYSYVAVVAGNLYGNIDNCHVTNSSVTCTYWMAGAMSAQYNNGNVTNCSVTNTTITGPAAVGALVGNINESAGERKVENCNVSGCTIVQKDSFGGNYDKMFGAAVGLINIENSTVHFNECTVENTTVKGKVSTTLYGVCESSTTVLINGVTVVNTADELKAALTNDNTVIIGADIENATIKLPATLNNFTLRAAEGVVLKNTTISATDGNAYHYENLTFDGITFDNSRILLTGLRTGEEVLKNLTVTNCVFQNIEDTTNTAAVHINKDASEPVENFTFTNNEINGAIGGSKSGVYAQVTGKVVFENNVINNVSFRPYVIQITTDDSIADTFTVRGNTFSGSSSGRAQGLGNNAEGTDSIELVVSGNIFKDITESQQICYWNFNAATTNADLSKNYYDIDIESNPSRIYYNAAASSVEDLKAMGVYPFYTELNADGTINLNSLKQAE